MGSAASIITARRLCFCWRCISVKNVIAVEMKKYGIESLEEAKRITEEKGLDVAAIVEQTQPIAFENAKWAYTLGAAIAIKKDVKSAAEAASAIGLGLTFGPFSHGIFGARRQQQY